MLPSSTTHVRTSLRKTLALMFQKPYIISDLLKDVDDKLREDFISKYTGYKLIDSQWVKQKDAIEIPVRTNYPQDESALDGYIFVGSGAGTESHDSIGIVQGSYDTQEVGERQEQVQPRIEGSTLVFTMSQLVGYVSDIAEIAIPDEDITFSGKEIRVEIPKNLIDPLTLVDNYTIMYGVIESEEGLEHEGISYGFSMQESVNVLISAMNLDTVTCLDLLVKASFIYMRKMLSESNNYALQNIGEVTPVQPLDESLAPATPNIIFGRQYNLSYLVAYSIDRDSVAMLNELNISGGGI